MNDGQPIEGRVQNLERFQVDIERRFKEAFPGGDHIGHSRYHELMIEQIEGRKRLTRAITEKTVSGLLWAAAVAVGLALWEWFKRQVRG